MLWMSAIEEQMLFKIKISCGCCCLAKTGEIVSIGVKIHLIFSLAELLAKEKGIDGQLQNLFLVLSH